MSTMTGETEFQDILTRSMDEIKKPENIPSGPWILRGVGWSTRMQTDKDTGQEYRQFQLRFEPYEAQDGVDPEAVAEGKYKGKVIFFKRNIKDAATAFRFKAFLSEKLKIDTSGRSTQDALNESFKGVLVLANVKTKTYTDANGDLVEDNDADNYEPASV